MPNNRNAQLRYQIIDRCMRNRGRQWTWYDILEKVNEGIIEDNPDSSGVTKITFYEDLKDIEYRIYNLDIERIKEGRTTYLRYLNPNDSINNQLLTETETELLKSAIEVLYRFKGIPQFDWIQDIVTRLESKMGILKADREIISFDSNIDYIGLQHISTFINAILNKRVLKINYKSFKTESEKEIIIHPQYLKQYNSRWFIMSFMDNWDDKPQIHALDRIINIQEINQKYFTISDFDWASQAICPGNVFTSSTTIVRFSFTAVAQTPPCSIFILVHATGP